MNFAKTSGTSIPIEKISVLCITRNATMFQRLIVQFTLYYLTNVRLKTKENSKPSALKVVAITYERWSLTRGSKYSDMTWKRLVFWKTGRRGEVVAYERCSQPEIRL